MPNSVNVRKKPDGTFDIRMNGKLIHESDAEKLLKRQLDPYGVSEDIYQDVLRQLAEKGEATVETPIVKIWQI